jgi:hypothetical protein
MKGNNEAKIMVHELFLGARLFMIIFIIIFFLVNTNKKMNLELPKKKFVIISSTAGKEIKKNLDNENECIYIFFKIG